MAKATDPISDRARALNNQIAALESEIKRLDSQLQGATTPRLRSTALPHGPTIPRKPAGGDDARAAAIFAEAKTAFARHKPEPPPASPPGAREPVFEEVKPLQPDNIAAPDQFNELGVRKYDLPALVARLRGWFNRPPPANPRLVTYLAAGGVQGLRPLRYEKRVARNRFIALVAVLLVILLVIFSHFLRNR